MIGKIRQKLISLEPVLTKQDPVLLCPICDRAIPSSQKDAHHLVPKSKGGKATEYLHRICHKQIHALFTETELANQFNHAAILREKADIIEECICTIRFQLNRHVCCSGWNINQPLNSLPTVNNDTLGY